jgi:MerR family transcriptional regulator, mercuric resistance operon regulatory protein
MPKATRGIAGEFSIGVLARQSGVNIETIRYYERVGVMPKSPISGALRAS